MPHKSARHTSLQPVGPPLASPLSPPPPSRRVCFANQEVDGNAKKRPRGTLEFDAARSIALLKLPLELDPAVSEGYA